MDSLFFLPTQALPRPRAQTSPFTLSFLCSAAQPTEAECDLSLQSHLKICQLTWSQVLRPDPAHYTAKLWPFSFHREPSLWGLVTGRSFRPHW